MFLLPENKDDLAALDVMMSGGIVSIMAICVIAPLLEEILFRGIILRGFLSHYSYKTSIVLSALLFAIVHFNQYQIPIAFIFGCFAGWIYYYSRSLWPVIFAHAIYNAGAYIQYLEQDYEFNSAVVIFTTFMVSLLGIYLLGRLFNVSTR